MRTAGWILPRLGWYVWDCSLTSNTGHAACATANQKMPAMWLCDSWPPRWPNDPDLLCYTLVLSSPTMNQASPLWPKDYGRGDGVWLLMLAHKRHYSLFWSLGSFNSGASQLRCHEDLQAASGEAYTTEVSWQQPVPTGQPYKLVIWKQILNPNPAFRWLQLHKIPH